MAINVIQFQQELSLPDFMTCYGTESQFEAALVRMRWQDGFVCPSCGGVVEASHYRRSGLSYWQCCKCRRQTGLYAGALFDYTRLPLTRWFVAIHLISQSKSNIAALELKRHLGVTWLAVWSLKLKPMEAMYRQEQVEPLCSEVSIDDAYLGGERTGGKRGRGLKTKSLSLRRLNSKTDALSGCGSTALTTFPSKRSSAGQASRDAWVPSDF